MAVLIQHCVLFNGYDENATPDIILPCVLSKGYDGMPLLTLFASMCYTMAIRDYHN